MANEERVRANFLTGTITDNPLTSGAVSMNSAELAAVPEITSAQHMVIVLDPLAEDNGPEVVHLVGHAGGATVGTIARNREGSAGAVEHPVDTVWVAVPVVSDVIAQYTEATRPNSGGLPYQGMMIYEVDTGRLLQYQTADIAGTAGWYPPWNTAWGVLGSSDDLAEAVVNSSFTAEEVHDTTDAVSVPAGRKIVVSMAATVQAGGSSASAQGRIRRGTTTGGTHLGTGWCGLAASQRGGLIVEAEDTPAASGSLRYTLTVAALTAMDSRTPGWWRVEDVGPA